MTRWCNIITKIWDHSRAYN